MPTLGSVIEDELKRLRSKREERIENKRFDKLCDLAFRICCRRLGGVGLRTGEGKDTYVSDMNADRVKCMVEAAFRDARIFLEVAKEQKK